MAGHSQDRNTKLKDSGVNIFVLNQPTEYFYPICGVEALTW